jgi:hypothetical protein
MRADLRAADAGELPNCFSACLAKLLRTGQWFDHFADLGTIAGFEISGLQEDAVCG